SGCPSCWRRAVTWGAFIGLRIGLRTFQRVWHRLLAVERTNIRACPGEILTRLVVRTIQISSGISGRLMVELMIRTKVLRLLQLRNIGDRTPRRSSFGKFPNATNPSLSPLRQSCQTRATTTVKYSEQELSPRIVQLC